MKVVPGLFLVRESGESGANGSIDGRTPSDMAWNRYVRLLERYRLPPIKIVHSVYAAKP